MSRCLIYKVHTARSAAGLYFSTLSSLCQALFSSFFQNFFHANRFGPCQLLPQRFCILAHPPAFVKNFFRLFPNLFVPHSAAGRSLRCPRGQLGYNTTPASLCQLLFSNFSRFFSSVFPLSTSMVYFKLSPQDVPYLSLLCMSFLISSSAAGKTRPKIRFPMGTSLRFHSSPAPRFGMRTACDDARRRGPPMPQNSKVKFLFTTR